MIYVVDDDADVRSSLSFLLEAADHETRLFPDGESFLSEQDALEDGCVLLDVRMPRVDGFHVMAEMERRGIEWPVIVMTGHGEVPVAVRAMKSGAVDFIEKPFSEDLLLASVDRAFSLLKDRTTRAAAEREAASRIASLTPREREVLQALMAGLPNKQVAARLDISLRTVEMHRASMMERLGVGSLAEALLLAAQARLAPLASAHADADADAAR